MSGYPAAPDLIDAVQAFLRDVEARLSGREAFHAKVAGNVLGIVARELRQSPDAAEIAALGGLLHSSAPLDVLRAGLCERLRDGSMDADTPGLLDALTVATLANLAADNPRFSTFQRLTEAQHDD